jgi:hypothetical protein
LIVSPSAVAIGAVRPDCSAETIAEASPKSNVRSELFGT